MITSLTQGIFIGIGLAIAGVPGAILWGAVVTVGERNYFGVIFLTIWGVIIVPIIEHVVRPWDERKDAAPRNPAPGLRPRRDGSPRFRRPRSGPLVFSLLLSIIDIYKQSFRIPDSEAGAA